MSGLSIGKNCASRFCQSYPSLAIPGKNKGMRKKPLILVDGFLEALPRGKSRQGFGGNPDLLAVGRAASGARLALARQESAESHHGDALSLGDVLDDRLEQRVHGL